MVEGTLWRLANTTIRNPGRLPGALGVFIKKYDEVLLIISSLIIFWFIIIHLIGLDEFKAFLNHTKTIVSSIDLIHGKKYPVPFFLSVKSNMAREPQEDFCYNLQLVY